MKHVGHSLALCFQLTVFITAVVGELETCTPLVACKDETLKSFHKTFLEIVDSPALSHISTNTFDLRIKLQHDDKVSGYTEYQGGCSLYVYTCT